MSYEVRYTKRALKDIPKIKSANLSEKLKNLIEVIKINPFQNPPPYERLLGDLKDFYSRRINIQHRLVYEVNQEKKQIKILSIWSHYENIWILSKKNVEYGIL